MANPVQATFTCESDFPVRTFSFGAPSHQLTDISLMIQFTDVQSCVLACFAMPQGHVIDVQSGVCARTTCGRIDVYIRAIQARFPRRPIWISVSGDPARGILLRIARMFPAAIKYTRGQCYILPPTV